jgi:hypothetical protein
MEDQDFKEQFEGTQGKFLFLSQTLLYSYHDYEGNRLPSKNLPTITIMATHRKGRL